MNPEQPSSHSIPDRDNRFFFFAKHPDQVWGPVVNNIVRYCSIVSWPEDGCLISRNMSPRTK